MSYEGREFMLCEMGHLTIEDAYTFPSDGGCTALFSGRVCNKPYVLSWSVDDTNHEGVDPTLFTLAEKVSHDCPVCGVFHIVSAERLAPIDEELQRWRKV